MNGFLWLGVACTLLLLVAVLVDGLDVLDAFDIGPGWFSLTTVFAFVAAFGFGTGAFADSLGSAAVVPGALAGVALGWGAVRLSRAAMHMPTDATETEAGLLGSVGRVITAPAEGRYGEVLLSRPTGPVKVACTAARPIATGTEVAVVDVASSTLVEVAPLGLDTPDTNVLDA
jgi:membrane-bound ClpP family serine protease